MRHHEGRPGAGRWASTMSVLAVVAALLGSCADAGASATPGPASRSPAPTTQPSPVSEAPSSTAAQTSQSAPATPAAMTPSPAPATPSLGWTEAGTMHLAHHAPTVLRLGDGRVLVVGDAVTDTYRGVLPGDTTRIVEIWSPESASWAYGPALNQPRDMFAAVVLKDGRALIAGGLSEASASYSSAYLFDPATNAWSKTGLLGTARYGSAAAVLADGRVLVVGGRYSRGAGDHQYGAADDFQLASYRSSADVDPGPTGRPLATAEVFDPRTGAWSPTGSMRWARDGASAVTLGDGRVLVVGGGVGPGDGLEIYDPVSGRFQLAPALPAPPADLLSAIGAPIPTTGWTYGRLYGATLVPLANGDALMSGVTCDSGPVSMEAALRFDSSANRWLVVGDPYVQRMDASGDGENWGTRHSSAVAVVRSDSRVVFVDDQGGRKVEMLDALEARWSTLPSLPVKMAGAMGVELADGSLLLVPAKGTYTDAYRLVPAG